MKVLKVTDDAFRQYGRIVDDVDFTALVEAMQNTPLPADVVYEPSIAELEALPVMKELEVKAYGEMPIQIGYCNGHNTKLNAFEYHKGSEINVAATDAILLLGLQQDITPEFTYDTAKAEAFLLPKGCAVELYGTSLHYAPCSVDGNGFRVTIVLPKGTNYPLNHPHAEDPHAGGEDGHLTAVNKWLLGHPEGGLPEGSPMGLIGENLDISNN